MTPSSAAARRPLAPWSAAALASVLGVPGVQAAQAAPDGALTAEFASQLRVCLRSVRSAAGAHPMGMGKVPIGVSCPAVAARLGDRPLPGMRGRALDGEGSMTLRQLEEMLRIVEGAAGPQAFVGQLSSARLASIIDALDPAARGEMSTRARLARWWRAMVGEFDPSQRSEERRRRRVEWPLGLWSSVSWIAFATAALLVASVLFQEVRAALALRLSRRRRPPPAARRTEAAADLASLDALPPRERAGATLRAVAARLHDADALPTPDPLTPREVQGGARVRERSPFALAVVAEVAEAGAFGRREPGAAALARAREAASRWLASGTPRPWPWTRTGAGRAP